MIQVVQSTAQLYRSTTQVYTTRDEYTPGLYKPCQTYQVYTRRTRYGLYIRRMFLYRSGVCSAWLVWTCGVLGMTRIYLRCPRARLISTWGVLGTACIDQGYARHGFYRPGVYLYKPGLYSDMTCIDQGCVWDGLYRPGLCSTQLVYIWGVLGTVCMDLGCARYGLYNTACIDQRCAWHSFYSPGVCATVKLVLPTDW